MLLLERGGQRRAAAHRFADAFDHPSRLHAVGKFQKDAERAVQRLAGAEQGRQLLGELQGLLVVEFPAFEQAAQALAAAGIGAARLDRQMALVLQAHDHFLGAGGLHLPVQGLAGRRQGLVAEQRHRPRLPASRAGLPRWWSGPASP